MSEQKIPNDTKQALDDYAQNGAALDGFFLAVVCNDLMEAVAKADSANLAALSEICRYIYSHLPESCWGSKEKYLKWRLAMRDLSNAPEYEPVEPWVVHDCDER